MRRALYTLFGLVIIAIVVVLVAPLLISAEDVRNRLFAEVENATGYRLRVNGPLDISVFPSLSLVAGDVGVAQRIGEQYQEFASADELRFGLSLGAILGGTVRMTEVALVAPVIRLPQPESQPDTVGQAASGDPAAGPGEALKNLSLDRLIITGGTLINADSNVIISDLDVTASLASYDDPLSLDVSATFDGQPLQLSGTIGSFGPFLDGTAAPVELTVSAPATLSHDVTLAGTAMYTETAFSLDDFTARAGDSAFGGSVAGDLSDDIPQIRASLNGELIDLDALMAKPAAGDGGGGNAPSSGDQPIDFSALSSLAANVDVSLSSLVVSGIAVQPLVAAVTVGGGKADVVADLIGVGGASGAGSVSVDANQPAPYVSGKLRITGVDLAKAGELAGQALPVTGTAGADIVFATAGATPQELQARINASGSVTLADGTASVPALAEAIGDNAAGTVSAINVTARFEDLVKPLNVTGSAAWRGERFDLGATADVRGILAGRASAVDAKASSKRVSAGFAGNVSSKGAGSGRVSLSTPSLTGLMRWLGQEPAWESGFEAFSVDGKLTVSETAIAFEDTKIRLDDTRGTGNGRITLGKKPDIQARLDLETLDINPYIGASGQASPAPSSGGPSQAGWDDRPIDFSALNAINADLALNVGALIYKQIKAGPVAITAKISGGKLNAELANLKLYGGAGAGSLSIDASGKVPAQSFKFSLNDLDAYPFLRDAAGFGRIEGTGNILVDLTGSGASQRAIVSALNGAANFEFANGAIRGINIAKMVRNLTTGTLSGWGSGEAEKTDFASLGARFAIANGQAKTDDLHLVGPLVRVAGSGTLDMPAQTLNFRVDPKVVASLEGQGSDKELEGLGVPVIVAGPWSKPQIYPDIAGILQNPQAAYDQLRKLGGGLFGLKDGDLGGDLGAKIGGIDQQLKDKTGLSIDDILTDGKVSDDAIQQGVAGLQKLLQNQVQPQGDQTQGAQTQGDQPQGAQPQAIQPQGDLLQGTLLQQLLKTGQPEEGEPQGGQPQGGQPQGGQPQGGQPQDGQPKDNQTQAALTPDLQPDTGPAAPQPGSATGSIPIPRPNPLRAPQVQQPTQPKQQAIQQPPQVQEETQAQPKAQPKAQPNKAKPAPEPADTGNAGGDDGGDNAKKGGKKGRKNKDDQAEAPTEQPGGQAAQPPADPNADPNAPLDPEEAAKQLLQGLFRKQE